jgi:hypothetical protein
VSRRVLSAALAAGALLLTAGAGTGAVQTPDLSSRHGVSQYLRSLGLSPDGFVVQRGAKNYAGPRCPGKGWSCTKATHVVQIGSRTAAATNSFTCTPASTGTNAATSTCVIVQTSTHGDNLATCNEQTADTVGGSIVQTCSITQTNSGGGKNAARVLQKVTHGPPGPAGQTQDAKQFATVRQSNDVGANQADVQQQIAQALDDNHSNPVSQNQGSEQHFLVQQSGTPFNPTSCPGTSGANTANASQTLKQVGSATATSGSQTQNALLDGHVDQCSSGVSTYTAAQSENQKLTAGGAGVTQTQSGPQQCCSFQGTNPADTCSIQQTSNQQGNQNPTQSESVTSTGQSSGNCTAEISVTQNGQTTAMHLSGKSFSQTLLCNQGNCHVVPPPGDRRSG